ncbi:MAG: valine--tRNA ligase [Pyrinomonadaceae bacterium]
MELAKAYDPKSAEENHYKRWEESGFFAPEINQDPDATPFSIVIPPPNVTGSLHMGHALQHTIMDVLTRWKRMCGYRTLWLPGTDHAGISVQRKVVEQLKKDEHKSPLDIGRDEFLRRCWQWKEQYGNTITEQMRREGASVDWSRHRFTMDESLSKAVRSVFVTLYEEGNIYRGLRIVNWCPKDKTVLSDLEVKEETKKDGKLYYLRYPVSSESRLQAASAGDEPPKGGTPNVITVATTRPETMLGDTAVAVNGSDERYKHLIGKMVALPLTNREIPLVADEYVDAEFGTGAVKVTPAHDPNDYQIGQRHDLPQILVMNMDGTMNAAAGPEFDGLDRFKAREKVVAMFDELGLLEKVDDYEITLPVCERCKTIVEPILSEQWFVKMDELRDLGLELANNNVPRFSPEIPHAKVYTAWLENLKDWTISRQLWWGHQIPAWYDADGNVYVANTEEEAVAKSGGKKLTQDSDVLDTWFSSGLWAFSTFGWTGQSGSPPYEGGGATASVDEVVFTSPNTLEQADHSTKNHPVGETPPPLLRKEGSPLSDLDVFLPTSVLVTGRDIIFLWVSRMMMLTKKFVNKTAFEDCVITGTVLGKDGKPMSKSRNNGVDPIEMFDRFGVDATRIYLASIATGADIKWNDIGVETYRNFANKIWNATRFCLMNSGDATVDHKSIWPQINADDADRQGGNTSGSECALADRWIISRLNRTALDLNTALDKYEFHTAVSLLYHFFWDDFCDWYIELKKDEITTGSPPYEGGVDAVSADGVVLSSQTDGQQADNSTKNHPVPIENIGTPLLRKDGSYSATRILTILEIALRMLHPFMPYLTEELWLKLPGTSSTMNHDAYRDAGATIMLTSFPPGDERAIDEQAENEMAAVIDVIKRVRNIRAEMNISTAIKFDVHIAADAGMQTVFEANKAQILKLAKAERLVIAAELDVPQASAKAVTNDARLAVPLEGLIDFDKERDRLANAIAKLTEERSRLDAQLANANFVERAPIDKVAELRERSAELEKQIETLNNNLDALRAETRV